MKSGIVALTMFIGALASVGSSKADTFELTATPIANSSVSVTPFTIDFNDVNNDSMLTSTSEVTFFSGETAGSPPTFYDQLIGIPDMPGLTNGGAGQWIFNSNLFGG